MSSPCRPALRACLALLLAGAGACRRPPPAPPAVAAVDGEPVLAAQLRAEIARVRRESDDRAVPGADEFAALRKAVLESLLERRLLLAEARRQGLAVADRELDEALARRLEGRAPFDEPGPADAGSDAAGEEAALRERTREQMLVDKLLLKEVVARTALGPDETMEYYRSHPDEFRRGEQVRVLHLVVPRREDAEALRRELVRGTDFAKLARQHSTSPEAAQGGDLGFFERGRMPPEFDEACFRLARGQVSEVVKTDYGFHLFKLVEKREAAVLPFARVEPAIELKLRREAVGKAQAAFTDRLRSRAKIEVFEAEIGKVMLDEPAPAP